eukprot:gene6835-105_t
MLSRHPVSLMEDVVTSSDEPVCFDSVAVGFPYYSAAACYEPMQRPSSTKGWSMCNHGRQRQFWAFRKHTARNLGVSLAAPRRNTILLWRRSDRGTVFNRGLKGKASEELLEA